MGNNESKTMITPEYMPPEVLLGYDSKLTDVWSLGIIIVELLNGIPIWYYDLLTKDVLQMLVGV
jgi:serine/threonine protein kinase